MDIPMNCVAKRTRYQRQKAEEELLEKARILKEEKDKRKQSIKRRSTKPILERRRKDDRDEASSSDIEIIDEKYIPPEQRSQLPNPKSKIAKLHQSIVIDQTPLPSPGRDSVDANQNQGIYKDMGAYSRSNSVSTSTADDFSYDKEDDDDDIISLGEASSDNKCESISQSSSEESDGESSDDDYNGDESANSLSESDDDLSSVEGNPVGEEVEYEENEAIDRERTLDNEGQEDDNCRSSLKDMDMVIKKRKARSVHEENGKKRKLHGMWVDETKRDYQVRESRPEQLQPPQDSESGKTKLGSGKPSCPLRVPDGDANESFHASDSDHSVQKSERESRIAIQKQSKRLNRQLEEDIDYMKVLADSIWVKGDALKEKLPPLKEKDHNENLLPLKFRFEDKDPTSSLEKDEEQREVYNLFADLEMGWIEGDIGSTKLSKGDNDDAAAEVTDPVESCRLGQHFLILDETIGIICKYCRIVQQEIKYLLPDLKTRTRRRSEWFDVLNGESSVSFEFQFGDSASGCDHPLIDAEGPIVNLIPAYLRRQMYPHQLEGFQFLWKNIAGATMIEDLRTPLPNGGTGCIMSHAPGTGKSFLTIVFLRTFMEVNPTCRPLIMAPNTMLRAWAKELKRWKVNIPFHILNDEELSGEENLVVTSIIQRMGYSMQHGKQDRDYKRMVKLYSWTRGRSILGIGYPLFETLAGEHRKGKHAEKFRKILLELPGILILDEGHIARNQNSLLWRDLTKVQTGRRIILSGTPFQNNSKELCNILSIVNPKFAEDISLKTGKCDSKRKNYTAKDRWASLTSLIDENDDDAVEELRAMMAPFVHVHKGSVLQENLPGLRDTLIVLNPSNLQKQLLQRIRDDNILKQRRNEKINFLDIVHLESLVSVHPSLLAQHEEFSDHKSILEELETNLEAGAKTQFVIEIIRLCQARDEKVLIFSEFIDPLKFLVKQLTSYFSWEEGKQVLYMDGKLCDKQRQLVISSLNALNSEAKVLLASFKACSEGINLVGASRVVLLDLVWNPSIERQAICRAYRLGQNKIVYVYRLIMSGTVDVDKYKKQVKKDRLSELLFPSPEGHNHEPKFSGSVSDDNILDTMVHHEKLFHIFEEILPQPKESNVFENFNFVSSAKS